MEEDSTLSFLLSSAAERFRGRPAIDFLGGASFSFGELDDLASRFAAGLVKLGVWPGERVVLCLPNSWQWVVAYHGVIKLGAVIVPTNPLLTVPELRYIVDDTEATAVVVPSSRVEGLQYQGARIISTDDDRGTVLSFAATLDTGAFYGRAAKPEDLVSIGYTSGTTGKPKGAMLTHRNIASCISGTVARHKRHAGDVVYSALPFPHVYGNIVLNSIFATGAKLVAPQRFKPDEAIAHIAKFGITLFEGVPTMYYQMLNQPTLAAADVSSLTRTTVGGQTMPSSTIDAIVERFKCPMLELWGMTEVSGPVVTHSPDWAPRHGSIGLPLSGSEARLADLGAGSEGAPGELLVRGPTVMKGYWRQGKATAEVLDKDGWLSTGDVAVIDGDGYIRIVDRVKDMILTAGYNIYPAEVEQVIATHPSVSMVAVGGIPDQEKGELAHAFVVLKSHAATDADALLDYCRTQLAAYKIPRAIHFVDDVPKASTG